jgi:hypothetical protein
LFFPSFKRIVKLKNKKKDIYAWWWDNRYIGSEKKCQFPFIIIM